MITSSWSICSACESLNWSAVSIFDLRVFDERVLDRLTSLVLAHAVGRLQRRRRSRSARRQRLGERRRRHQPVADEVGVAVDAGDGQLAHLAVLERRLDGRADLQVEVLGRILVDEDAALLQPLPAPLIETDVDELLEGHRVGGAERLLVAVDLSTDALRTPETADSSGTSASVSDTTSGSRRERRRR